MRKFLKRMTGIFLCVAMAAGVYGAIPVYAEGTDTGTDIQAQAAQWPTGPAVQAASAIIMDASTGTVLYEKDADTPRYPASITKIMTAMLALQSGKLNDTVTITQDNVTLEDGSQVCGFVAGDQVTLDQLLHCLLVYSGNDAASAIAEYVGGNTENFVQMMNDYAAKLGCTGTHFSTL